MMRLRRVLSLLFSSFFVFCCLQVLFKMHETSLYNKFTTRTEKKQPRFHITGISTTNEHGTEVTSVKRSGLAANEISQKKELFRLTITREEKEIFRNALIEFMNVCSDDLNFMLHGGSLLGAYRHHDMIPWDDDVDIFMSLKDMDVIKRRLKTLEPRFFLEENYTGNLKLYPKGAFETPRGWNWPYLDIFFYDESEMHIWNARIDCKDEWYFKELVFPLTTLPFMGMDMPAPKDYKAYLGKTYFLDKCKTNDFSHKYERSIQSVEIPCSELRDRFYFAN